jgi:hypothetical protein
METYFFHQNKGWGSLAGTSYLIPRAQDIRLIEPDVHRKLQRLEHVMPKTLPVKGFATALRKLHALGHPLHIVTVRPERCRVQMIEWLAQQGITVGLGDHDIVAAIWTTDAYGLDSAEAKEVVSNDRRKALGGEGLEDDARQVHDEELNASLQELFKNKVASGGSGRMKLNVSHYSTSNCERLLSPQVLRGINASLFIDDHHGNLEPIVHSQPQIPCLLFGKYAWNMHRSGGETPVELMSHEQRVAGGLDLPKHEIELVDGLERAETWEDVIKWVQAWDQRDPTRAE